MSAEAAAAADDPKPGALDERQLVFATVVLFLVLGCLTVAGNLRAPFSTYDDTSQVVQNPQLLAKTPWAQIFQLPEHASYDFGQFVPVTWVSFKLNYLVFGRDSAWSFRAVNWLLHSASGLLLFGLLLRLGLRRFQALFLALAWTAHPLACESVAWITQRSNCLAFCFGVAGFYAYVRWHSTWRGILLGIAGVTLAFFSKPAALGWIPIFLAYELTGGPVRLVQREFQSSVGNWAGAGIRVTPFVVLAGLFTCLGIRYHEFGLMPPPGGAWYTALMTDAEIFTRYIGNILLPFNLSAFYYVEEITSVDDLRFYAWFLALAALVGGTLWAARTRSRALFGWLWFFGGLATNANVIAIVSVMQDRYVYLSSVGLLLVLVETVLGLRDRMFTKALEEEEVHSQGFVDVGQRVSFTPLTAVAVLYLAGLGGLTVFRSFVWSSPYYLLFQEAIERQPQSGLARIYYATQLEEAAVILSQPGKGGNETEALKQTEGIVTHLAAAFTCRDTYRYHNPMGVHLSLAKAYLQTGKRQLTRQTLEKFAPPTAPAEGDTAGLPEKYLRHGFRLLVWNGRTYKYKLDSLASVYLTLARADLNEFQDPLTSPEEARVCLEFAEQRAEEARMLRPRSVATYYLKAGLFLARDFLGDPAASEKERAERALSAKSEWKRAQPNLAHFYLTNREESPEEDGAAEPLVPMERLRAIGYLALAEAALWEAQEPERKPEEARDLALQALQIAERAVAIDPAYPESLWLQGRLHLSIDDLHREKLKDPEASLEHYQKGKALWEKVPATSPRYETLQKGLRSLVPPPDSKSERKTKAATKTEAKTELPPPEAPGKRAPKEE